MTDIFFTHTFITLLLGSSFCGAGAALVGTFIYFKQQGTMGDVISHASFPGAMLAFFIGLALLGNGRDLTMLTVLALGTGAAGAFTANLIERKTPLGTEVSMVATISLYFSCGMLLLAVIQSSALPGKGGISEYLLGNATHLTTSDTIFSVSITSFVIAMLLLNYRKLKLTVFDIEFAKTQGVKTRRMERLLFILLAAVIVTGMRTIGLLLIVGFLIMPAATARQWTTRFSTTALGATLLGSGTAIAGTVLSTTILPAPTGAVIILLLFSIFLLSLIAAPNRGMIYRALQHRHLSKRYAAAASTATVASVTSAGTGGRQ
ncbi:metal ABC transporter permease [Leucobacter sp. OH2974_COT-288]|nr:metal ABC transporter permease [Leucobacter sp. OH2974_COT-288]